MCNLHHEISGRTLHLGNRGFYRGVQDVFWSMGGRSGVAGVVVGGSFTVIGIFLYCVADICIGGYLRLLCPAVICGGALRGGFNSMGFEDFPDVS